MDVNEIKGDITRYQALGIIHDIIKPKVYFEIGVLNGLSLRIAKCRAFGVDPNPLIKSWHNHYIFRMSSDEFFSKQRIDPPDLIFIDGLHLFEQALKDFINCEKISHMDTIILVDDILPNNTIQAERVCRSKKWTGDVWKLLPTLLKYRPDLTLRLLNTSPAGMLMVKNINPNSTKEVKNDYTWGDIPPDFILQRRGVRIDTKSEISEWLK